MIDYKKKLEDIAKVVGIDLNLKKDEDLNVELAVEKEEVKEEEAPVETAPQFVTATEFQAFKDENEKFKSDLMETFEKMIEMVGQNEKNNVPKELAKEGSDELTKEVEKEVVEMAAEQEVVVHSPDSVEKEITKMTYGKQGDSVQSRIWDVISQN